MRRYPDLPLSSYIGAVLFNGICRVSVPIFFMISGALLLEQPIDLKRNSKKSLFLVIKTSVWGVVFIIWDYLYLGDIYSINDIFTTPVRAHFWFLYVMIGIYITVPLWQKLVSGDSRKLMKYFSFAFIGLLVFNFVLNTFKISVTYEIPLIGNSVYAGYFIMGYIIRHFINDINIKGWICYSVLTACVCATNLLTFLFSKHYGSHVEKFSDFKSGFIGIAALTVFYLFMKKDNLKPCAWITLMSKHSFNIYMMHVFFLDIIQINIDISKFNSFIGFPVFFVFLISLSLGFSWIYEKAKGKFLPML